MADIVAPIGTTKLAERWKCSPSTAYRRLKRLRDVKGDHVFTQDAPHRPLRTSIRALNDADRHAVELKKIEKEEIEREVALRFRSRIAAQEKANAILVDRVKSLELQAKELRETVALLLRGLQSLANGPGKNRT